MASKFFVEAPQEPEKTSTETNVQNKTKGIEKPSIKEYTKDAKDKHEKEVKEGKEKQEKDGKEKQEKDGKEKHEKETKDIHAKAEAKEHNETTKGFLTERIVASTPMPGAAQPDKIYQQGENPKYIHKEYILETKHYLHEAFGPVFTNPGDPVEQRLNAIEQTVASLLHFIPTGLRPDLSQGALKQESDVAATKTAKAVKTGGTRPTNKRGKKAAAKQS